LIDNDSSNYRKDRIPRPMIEPGRPVPNEKTGFQAKKNIDTERPKPSSSGYEFYRTEESNRPVGSTPISTFPKSTSRKLPSFSLSKTIKIVLLPLILLSVALFIFFGNSQTPKVVESLKPDPSVSSPTDPDSSVSVPVTTIGSNDSGSNGGVNWSDTARMIAVVDGSNDVDCPWFGSGTIVGDGSYVLTNAHVAIQDDGVTPCELYILLSASENEVPTDVHPAVVVSFDVALDLAVLRIVDSNSQPFSPIGVSQIEFAVDYPELGEELTIIGFPGIGGQRVTLTRGNYAGLSDELPPYYKTDASINGGNSGGGAFNSLGQLVGVPTGVYYDENDASETPLGLVRPVKDALALLERASNAPLNATSTNQLQETGSGGGEYDETDPRFDTCREAKSNGYGPYYSGADVEYDWYQDRDSDGIVCE